MATTTLAQISGSAGSAAMTLLVLIFAWLYKRDPQRRARKWLAGWIAIEIHFAANLVHLWGWIPAPAADWLAYSTLLFAAANFFLSVTEAHLTRRATLVFWSLIFSPALLYVTLLVSGQTSKEPYALILVTVFIASAGLFALRASRKVAAALSCIALGAAPAVLVMLASRNPAHGVGLLLFDAFGITGLAWWMNFRRTTPGVILAPISFAAWGCVWPCAVLLSALGLPVPDSSVLWDMPKYFVAFAMIITLFEEQAETLRKEIAERGQAENALRESAFLLAESQRIAQLGSYTFTLATGACTLSGLGRQILGLDSNDRVSVSLLLDLLNAADQNELTAYFGRSVLRTGERFNREFIVTRKSDGAERCVHLHASVVEIGAGTRAVSGTLQDITEVKITEQELIQAKKMESIGRLAGGVAHDFNNLLTIINGYSELILTRMGAPDPLRTFVDEIRNAGVRAAELTHQLLAFSRRQTLQPVDLDLNRVIAETERLLAHLLAKNIQIVTNLEPGLSKIKADPGQLTQVLLNLAVNARDAMPRGGRLNIETANVSRLPRFSSRIRVSNDVTFVRVSVTDSGSGMDEETQKAPVRAVLHDQAARVRYRLGALHGLRNRKAEQRVY